MRMLLFVGRFVLGAGDGVAERVAGNTHECSPFGRQNPTRKYGRGGGWGAKHSSFGRSSRGAPLHEVKLVRALSRETCVRDRERDVCVFDGKSYLPASLFLRTAWSSFWHA